MEQFINPIRDIFIKFLFGTDENRDLLLSFINAVLEDADFPLIKSVELMTPFNHKTFVLDKESVLDVKAADANGRLYNIEVQCSDFNYFENRSLYYWAKLYSSQLSEGHFYTKLKPVICINLVDGALFKETENLHSCFMLTEKSNSEYMLTDHLVMHFLEIEKIKDTNIKEHLRRWIDFFRKEGKEDMTILLKDDPVIEKAHKAYTKFTRDDELREIYEAREKWKRDYESSIHEAEEKGIEKGIEKGKIEDARKMLQKGYPVDDIAEITGLSIEEIGKLSR